ncbi:hypothetical protein DERP_008908 [Dermatophagoides pteronyssinus]|uniref:Uncharacterized protein n=1 Tax=Dermatophagoides pteronyssinus TaxID=6956 RepID=A0ABQ8JNX1_DERPT|nr:hypothetical protein DERP_008908 [Dermatophagoides pteronyssinus]
MFFHCSSQSKAIMAAMGVADSGLFVVDDCELLTTSLATVVLLDVIDLFPDDSACLSALETATEIGFETVCLGFSVDGCFLTSSSDFFISLTLELSDIVFLLPSFLAGAVASAEPETTATAAFVVSILIGSSESLDEVALFGGRPRRPLLALLPLLLANETFLTGVGAGVGAGVPRV